MGRFLLIVLHLGRRRQPDPTLRFLPRDLGRIINLAHAVGQLESDTFPANEL